MTWKAIHALTGKPIIADDGYGVAGASTGHDITWDAPANLNARIGDGVVSITQANPKADWNGVIAGVRGQLGAVQCQTGIRYDASRPKWTSIRYQGSLFEGDLLGRSWPEPPPSHFVGIPFPR